VKFPLVAGVASAVLNVATRPRAVPSYSANGAAAANSIRPGHSSAWLRFLGVRVRLVGGVRWGSTHSARDGDHLGGCRPSLRGVPSSSTAGWSGLVAGLAPRHAAFRDWLCILRRSSLTMTAPAASDSLDGSAAPSARPYRRVEVRLTCAVPRAGQIKAESRSHVLRPDHGVSGRGLRGRRGGVRLSQTKPPHEVVLRRRIDRRHRGALAPFRDEIVLLRQENRGVASARKAAAAVASGDFWRFSTPTTIYLPDRLEALGRLAAERLTRGVDDRCILEVNGRVARRAYNPS